MISEKEKLLRLISNAISELTYITSCNVSSGDYDYIVRADHILREAKELLNKESE